jgi:hypothetical protein
MNTLTEAAPARPARTAAPLPTTPASSPAPGLAVRALGAGSTLLVALHLALAIVFVPRWPEANDLVQWSALGVPIAMIAISVAMWLTHAAARPLLALQYVTATLVIVSSAIAAYSDDELFVETLDMWTMLAALVAQYLVALGVLARGVWRGVHRVLPIAGASWGAVVLPIAMAFEGTEAVWWTFVLYVCGGLIVNGLALAIRPTAGTVAR